MRAGLWIVTAGIGLAAIWGGCVVEPSTNKGNGGSGGGSSSSSTSSSSSSSGKPPPDCSTVFNTPTVCEACAQTECCQELDACKNEPTCWDCFTGGQKCDQEGQLFADVRQCRGALCMTECAVEFPVGTAACGVPVMPPSKGACVTLGGVAGCNPITNEGCNTAAGDTCDFTGAETFACFVPPNDVVICGACDIAKGPFCAPGSTCLEGKCARYCCDDGDCGPNGKCSGKLPANPGTVGACVDDGAGGGGGAGGMMMDAGTPDSGMGGMGGMMMDAGAPDSGTGGMGGAGGMGGMMMDAGADSGDGG